jgi:hypothetical protein
MRNASKRVGLLTSSAAALAVIAAGVVLAAGTAAASTSVHAAAYRLTATLTPNQVVPAVQAPAGAVGHFHGVLIMSGAGATKVASLAGCKVVVPPRRSGLPIKINCGSGAVGTVPGAPGQWRLIWRLSVSHLSGPATAASIHLASAGQSAAPAFTLCSPCKSVAHGVMALSGGQASSLSSSSSEYVDVATAAHPNGEIRGQITRSLAGIAFGR